MKVGVWDRTEDVNKLKFAGKKLDEDEVFKILSFVQVFGENCWKSIKKLHSNESPLATNANAES